MHRLAVQDQLLTQEIGFFPDGYDTQAVRAVLDLACGSGGWALDLARSNPQIKVVGIDISKRMIDFDQVQAEAQGLHTASFLSVLPSKVPGKLCLSFLFSLSVVFCMTNTRPPTSDWRKDLRLY